MIWAEIITGLTVVGFVYTFLRNFKDDITNQISRVEKRLDDQDDRIFWLLTGKRLQDAILEEKMKKQEKKAE
jgi:hypothetical protein